MIHYYNINHQILADKTTQVGQKKKFNSQTIINNNNNDCDRSCVGDYLNKNSYKSIKPFARKSNHPTQGQNEKFKKILNDLEILFPILFQPAAILIHCMHAILQTFPSNPTVLQTTKSNIPLTYMSDSIVSTSVLLLRIIRTV